MDATAEERAESRRPLSRQRVLRAGLERADEVGLAGLSMRHLAAALDVVPMALYNHVANKDDLVDGMIDLVFSEIDLPSGGADWKTAMRERGISLRDTLYRHRWAIGLMESRRRPGSANLKHHDAVIGKLRGWGFSIAMAAHAYSVLDAYIYGYALTNFNLPYDTADEMASMAQDMFEPFPAGEYPNLAEFVTDHVMHPGYDHELEFTYGLDLILSGLDKAISDAGASETP